MLRRTAGAVGGFLSRALDQKTLTVVVVLVISLAVLFSVIDNIRARRQSEDSNVVLRQTNQQLVQQASQAAVEAKKNGQQIMALQQQVADQNRQLAALRKQLADAGRTPPLEPSPAPGASPGVQAGSGADNPHTGDSGGGGTPGHPRPSPTPTRPQQPPTDGGSGGVVGAVCHIPIVHELLC